MKKLKISLTMAICLTIATIVSAQSVSFPLKYSDNKRYFVDQKGQPFLYNADTGWQLFIKLSTNEAREYLIERKKQGYNTILAMIAYKIGLKNYYGDYIFDADNDFTKPNEAYHNHVKKIINIADSLGLMMVVSQPWVGCCNDGFGDNKFKVFEKNGPAKSEVYGKYLGQKFSTCKNLFWIVGGDSDPKGLYPMLTSFAQGLYQSAPKHQLITYHGNATRSSTDLFQYANWLGFSSVYTYWREKPGWVITDLQPHVYESSLREYTKSDIMPFVLTEAQYEGTGAVGNDMGNAQIIRRQAYWTMLCGAAGHTYGSDIWNFPSNWRDIMKYEGANQLAYFYDFFKEIPWHTLIPDYEHNAVVGGYGDWTKNNYVTTAVSADKKLLVLYMPEIQPVVINFGYLEGDKFICKWYNPTTGKFTKQFEIKEKTVQKISPAYGGDWVLLITSN